MKFLFFAITISLVLFGCQPAKSDVFVEMVNPELVKKLKAGADSIQPINGAWSTNPLTWVRGERLLFPGREKSVIIWYDEQGNLTGMLEYENSKLRDSIAFHANGQRIFSLIIDANGLASGPARYYYPDGRVREDGRFTKGIRTGVWRQFNSEGRLVSSREYDRFGKPSR